LKFILREKERERERGRERERKRGKEKNRDFLGLNYTSTHTQNLK
jgi:hypothetical protein